MKPKRVSFRSIVEGIRENLGGEVQIMEHEEWLKAVKKLDQSDGTALGRFPTLKI